MRTRLLFILAALGLIAGLVSAYVSAKQPSPQPPVFDPASNPYPNGIYANGIVESRQDQGANISIFPEVSGPVTKILAREGESVNVGAPLIQIDDSVQRQTTAQQQTQIAVVSAQIESAKATLKTATDTEAKLEGTYRALAGAISQDQLDDARNAAKVAQSNLLVYQQQYAEQINAAAAASALLQKYTIRAPRDGVVLSINTAPGSYVSSQGAYDVYTQGYLPILVMGSKSNDLEVRCYVDEILISRLPPSSAMHARMFIRGTKISIPLIYERMQPYVSPKIELSDQRTEQVDVRVLPIIFRIAGQAPVNLYPGQLVDVYVSGR
jgi:HlyD family secretion protein